MAEKHIDRYQGFVLPVAEFSVDKLADKGAGATDSAYTQANPRAGVPSPSNDAGLVLQAAGDQSADGHLEFYAQQGGMTSAGRAGYVWRDVAAGDNSSEYMGQDSPNLITGLDVPWYTISQTLYYRPRPQPLTLANGNVLSALTQIKSSGALKLGTYSPSSGTWSDANFTPDRVKDADGNVYEQYGPALVQRADNVVVLIMGSPSGDNVDVYTSSDDGATWSACAYNALATRLPTDNIAELSAAVDLVSGDVVLFVHYEDSSTNPNLAQYVSYDGGASFELVQADYRAATTYDATRVDVVALPGGGFVFGMCDDNGSTSQTYVARLSSASYDGSTLAFVSPAGAGAPSGTITARGFALLVSGPRVLAYMDQSASVPQLAVYFSDDAGATWQQMHGAWATTTGGHSTGGYLHTWGVAETEGKVVLVTRWSSTSDTHDPYSTAALYLGGHSRHTMPSGNEATGTFDAETYAFDSYIGWDRTRGIDAGAYLVIGAPTSMAWTATGAGTGSISTAQWDITTAAGQTLYYERAFTSAGGSDGPLGDGPRAAVYEVEVEIDAATGNNLTDQISLAARFSDSNGATASFVYELELRMDSGGYRLYDTVAGAAINAIEQSVDLTAKTRIRVAVDMHGNVKTWYAVPGHARAWAEGIGSTTQLQDDSGTNPGNTNLIEWGHRGAFAGSSRWSFVGYNHCALRWGPTSDDSLGAAWSNPDDLRQRELGGEFESVTDGLKVRGVSGAACRGDTWQVEADYEYPVDNLLVYDEPQPEANWRATGETEAKFVFDLEAHGSTSYMTSRTLACFALGANFKTFYLEGYDGATWQQLGEGDASAGFTGMTYARSGSKVYPGSGSFTVENYIFRGAHVGDTVDLGSSKLRKLTANTEGTWTDGTAHKPVLTIDGFDGTEPASGTATLWARDYGVVVHDRTDTYELYRIRVPAQSTADGAFRGKFVLGPVVAFGHQYDRGWAVRKERQYTDTALRSGRRRRTKLGKVRRVYEVAWVSTAVDASRAYLDQTSELPNYIVPGASEPGATPHDTLSVVEGVVEELEGRPALYLRNVESGHATQQLTRREAFALVRITTNPHRDNVLGDEVDTPLDRLNVMRLEEV